MWLRGLRSQLVSTRMRVRSLASLSGRKIGRCCELWCRLATIALIRPLVCELPYVTGTVLKSSKNKIKYNIIKYNKNYNKLMDLMEKENNMLEQMGTVSREMEMLRIQKKC